MIFFFIAAWLAYKKAKETNRNGIVWALITSGAFIGTQLLIGVSCGIFILLFAESDVSAEQTIGKYEIVINIISVVASVIVTILILKYLGRVPPDDSFTPPPSPPTFN